MSLVWAVRSGRGAFSDLALISLGAFSVIISEYGIETTDTAAVTRCEVCWQGTYKLTLPWPAKRLTCLYKQMHGDKIPTILLPEGNHTLHRCKGTDSLFKLQYI